ncbi:related to transposase [Sporisorium reilianum f. sp. reilianum]|uniref:Related to transposase n=1 Tax=Sporisorium reilianum f. sp. reilianum TaxID=72559 RepID=A0A2N8UPE9_9BASI|nr:related to transposase [Sporisorium reilianum f. sp. reilianum]
MSARTKSAAQQDQKEACLQQAAEEYCNGQHPSICKAAAAHDIHEASLHHQMEGRHPKKDAQASQQRLPPEVEAGLIEYIRHHAYSGYPLTPTLVHQYATTLMHRVPGHSQAPEVTHTWLQSFLIRHPVIQTHWSCCLDNARLMGATEDNIRQWYNKLAEIMHNFGIASTDVFNMDETGFIFGQAGSEHVVIPSGDLASWFKAQPGTQELATIVKCIRSGGQVLLPLIITKGVHHTVSEHWHMNGVPASWHFMKSSNGWTNNELTVKWLKNIYDPSTRPLMQSQYRLLIIDGHGSHMTDAFCDSAWSHRIILLMLLAHATHVMQLLDVSIFGPLTGFLEKVLRQLASGATAAKHSGTLQQQLLQEIAIPHSTSAFNTTMDAFGQEPNSRDHWTLKHLIIQAHKEAQASIAVLEAEVVLMKDHIITCEEAERVLAEKEASTSRNGGGNCQDEEEEVTAAPPAAAPDDNDTSKDDDKGGLTSLMTPSPSPMQLFLDDLDNEQPLNTIDEVDPGSFGFFDSLPQASPSHTKH